jgi:hypothetical protein
MVTVLCRILAERRELEKSELVYGEPSIKGSHHDTIM